MARLIVKTSGVESQAIDLKLGINRLGRSPDSDFQIVHTTVSSDHCEILLKDGGIVLRDLESTNGTFLDGERIRQVELTAGQTIHLGEVEIFIESTDVKVAIPTFENPDVVAPPVVSKSGVAVCPRHPGAHVTHQCTNCKEVMCDDCAHRLRRKGSKKLLRLCPICSHLVDPIGGTEPMRRKSLLDRVSETVKLKLSGIIRR